jgi:cephalosporin hydroxylase
VAADDATIVTINLPGGGFEVGDLDSATVRSYARGQQRIEILPGDSHDPDVLAHASSLLGRQPDFVFVDGDHTYAGVQTDYQMYAPLLRPGGLIVFHDIVKHRVETGCEVDRLWDEIKSAYDYTELADQRPDPGRGPWGGIGVLRVPEDRR